LNDRDSRDDYDDEPRRPRSTVESVVGPTSDLIRWCALFQLGVSIFAIGLTLAGVIEWPLRVGSIFDLLVPLGLAGIVLTPITLAGSMAMLRMRRHSLAVAACVITIMSLPCVIAAPLTAPIGIWALMMLNRPDVRARFDTAADTRSFPG
jgi:hypothetical protein